MFFLWKNYDFFKNRLSKITSISASILVPTCLHVALENRRFSDFWRFQEAFKISSFFVSIFYRFWLRLGLQHGAILGAKTAQNPKKWLPKTVAQLPKRVLDTNLLLKTVQEPLGLDFWGGQASIFDDFWMIFGTSWLTLGMFSAALSCLGFRCSWLGLQPTLPRKSKNLPRTKPRIQEPAEDKAEKKIRTNAFRKTQILPSLVLPNSLPYRNPPYSKNVGRRYSPQGGFNPPPYGVGVLDKNTRSSYPPSGFFFSEVLVFPLLNPPPVASGRLLPLRRFAALAPLGGSWAEKIAFQEAFKN